MKKDIILAGVGGQGVLSIAAIIAHAAVSAGLSVRQSPMFAKGPNGPKDASVAEANKRAFNLGRAAGAN